MPILDFKCPECGCTFDELVKDATDTKGVICPKCGRLNPQRLFTFEGSAAAKQECTHHCATCNGCKH